MHKKCPLKNSLRGNISSKNFKNCFPLFLDFGTYLGKLSENQLPILIVKLKSVKNMQIILVTEFTIKVGQKLPRFDKT